MIKLYFKQAFHLLGENKLLSSISIIGTALAIAMIMVIVITLRATIAPFAPETHRDRMLIFRFAGLQNKSNVNWQSNGPIGYNTAKACFKAMTIPEAVSISSISQETMLAAKPAGEMESCSVLQTDDAFWKYLNLSLYLVNRMIMPILMLEQQSCNLRRYGASLVRNIRSGWKNISSESFRPILFVEWYVLYFIMRSMLMHKSGFL